MEYFIKDSWINVNISNGPENIMLLCPAMNIDNTLYVVDGIEFLHLDLNDYPIIRRARTHIFIVHKKGEILDEFKRDYFTLDNLAYCVNGLYECHTGL